MTRLVLDQDRTIAGTRMAVISDVEVEVTSRQVLMAGTGRKTPRFVLIEQFGELMAFTPRGSSVPLSEVERLCPALLTEFATRSA